MRIVLLVNNWVGWQLGRWLKETGCNITGLVLHPPDKRRYGDEILRDVELPETCVFDGAKLRCADLLDAIARLRADVALSISFGYILKPEFISIFPQGVINLHSSYLPFNRGSYPNVWSIIDNTPAGVTLHYIDMGIDTGDIIARKLVEVEPIDTGETLYRKLEMASVKLFTETWPLVMSGRIGRTPQSTAPGTSHTIQDVEGIDEIDMEHTYTGSELINIIRARTFPPYPGAYFRTGGRKVYLRLQLMYEDELRGK